MAEPVSAAPTPTAAAVKTSSDFLMAASLRGSRNINLKDKGYEIDRNALPLTGPSQKNSKGSNMVLVIYGSISVYECPPK
jgi:hypothetical protein